MVGVDLEAAGGDRHPCVGLAVLQQLVPLPRRQELILSSAAERKSVERDREGFSDLFSSTGSLKIPDGRNEERLVNDVHSGCGSYVTQAPEAG